MKIVDNSLIGSSDEVCGVNQIFIMFVRQIFCSLYPDLG